MTIYIDPSHPRWPSNVHSPTEQRGTARLEVRSFQRSNSSETGRGSFSEETKSYTRPTAELNSDVGRTDTEQ